MRRKNAKEMFGGFFKNMVKSADEVLISGIKVSSSLSFSQYMSNNNKLSEMSDVCMFLTQEVDEFFEQEKTFLLDYYSKIKDSTAKAEKMTRTHKSICLLTMLCFSSENEFKTVFLGLLIFLLFTDIADDYILISATLNCLSADDSTANKK